MRIITIAFADDDLDEAERAYDAIERLLGEMGQIGTLSIASEKEVLPGADEHAAMNEDGTEAIKCSTD